MDGGDAAMSSDSSDAFEDFVRSSYQGLVRYAQYLLGNTSEAEDLVQTALLKTSAAWSRMQSSGSAIQYARVIMVRAAWRSARRRTRQLSLAKAELAWEQSSHLEEAVDDRDLIRRGLACLPVGQRVVLVLRYLEDLSEAETARRLRCRVGTVKSRSARALSALREMDLLQDSGEQRKD